MTIQTKYTTLRNEFLCLTQPCVDDERLRVLKNLYAESIDSTRKLSYAKDLKALIRLLEKRDILNYENIEPLWYVVKNFCDEPDLRRKLEEYEALLKSIQYFPRYNMYQASAPNQHEEDERKSVLGSYTEHTKRTESLKKTETLLKTSKPEKRDDHLNYCRIHPSVDYQIEMLQQEVLMTVSDRIGRSWRDVARYLGIRECEIDAAHNKFPYNLKEQSYEVLKNYISQSDGDKWKLDLMRALERGRRRDLKELVEDIILNARIE